MLKTLIVEDEAIIRKGLISTFSWQTAGCMIIGEAQNGLEGLEKIRELHPDLVITDITMPEMDGLTMLEEGLKQYPFQSIILTGYSEFEFARKAVDLHVFAYILKPISHEELMNAILSLQSAGASASDLPAGLWTEEEKAVLFEKRFGNYHVNYVIDMIKKRFSEQHISLEGLAGELFVSKSYLSQKFHDETGCTFSTLLNKYRLQQAILLLNSGRYRVSETAQQTGFNDYKNFNAVLKKYMGCTATEYIKSIRQ